jgi:UDP-glucuronate 4-epimerase
MDYISVLEDALEKKAYIEMYPLQPGDVPDTFADISDLTKNLNYVPCTSVKEGVRNFVSWYKEYFRMS